MSLMTKELLKIGQRAVDGVSGWMKTPLGTEEDLGQATLC